MQFYSRVSRKAHSHSNVCAHGALSVTLQLRGANAYLRLACFECRNQMINLRIALIDGNSHNIKSHGYIQKPVLDEIATRNTDNLLLFGWGYRFFRQAKGIRPSCFYLYKDQGFPIFRNYINFTEFVPEIPGDKRKTLFKKVSGSNIFSLFTEINPLF